MYTPEQIASINAARAANVAAGRDAYSGAGATIANPGTSGARPRFTPITSISSSDFGTRRQSLPTAPIPTAFNALRAVSDGVGNAPILEMNTQTAEDGQPSAYQRTKDRIYSLIGLQGTQGAETAKLQEEQGLEAKQNDLNRLTNLYTTTQKSWQDRIKAAQNNPGGTSEINNVQANTITRQANEDLANIAIQKSVAQGDLNTANEIIKSKIEAKFEPIKNEIQGLKEYIALNNDDLTDKEKLTIQDQINQKEEQRKSLTNAQIDAYRLALQNNAPKDVLAAIGASNTVEDTYAALGDYGVDAGQELDNAYKRAQISKLNREDSTKNPKFRVTSTDIDEGTSALEQSRGSDGHVDTALYTSLYADWIDNGGSRTEFLNYFPPNFFLNPKDPTVPGHLKPTGKNSNWRG